jgi:hypothetical protein
MASWKEIERIRKDPASVRRIAKLVLGIGINADLLTEWEIEFLEPKTHCREELTTRQGEKLLEIRDNIEMVDKVGYGFSVRILFNKCHMARRDLGGRRVDRANAREGPGCHPRRDAASRPKRLGPATESHQCGLGRKEAFEIAVEPGGEIAI